MSAFDIAAEIYGETSALVPIADLRIVGGFAASALIASEAIDPEKRLITLGPDASISVTRPNGTRRDLDLMTLNTDPKLGRELFRKAVLISAGRLTVSLSQAQAAGAEYGSLRKCRHVIDARNGMHIHKVGPFAATLHPTIMEPWQVTLATGASFLVNSPRFQVASYYARRLRGVHPKDRQGDKLTRLEAVVRGIPAMCTADQDEAYAGLDNLAQSIRMFQEMSVVMAARRYGIRSLASKVGNAFFTSAAVTRHYQRVEDRKADAVLRQLQALQREQVGGKSSL